MASSKLTPTYNPSEVFRRYILTNLEYWHDFVVAKRDDLIALERGHNRIVKAILFALDLEGAWPSVRELIETFSPYMERGGHWDTWNRVLQNATEVAQRAKDQASIVALVALLARLLQRQSHFRQAVNYHHYTIRAARQIDDQYNEARTCSNLGFFYAEQGHWWRAEILCCHALNVFEKLDSHHGRAHTENHLGILYSWQGRRALAQQHLERACSLWQVMGDDHGLMHGYLNLSTLYLELEAPDEALIYLQKALHQATLTGEEGEVGTIYMNLGITYRQLGDPVQAEAYAWQAEAVFQRYSNLLRLALVRDNLGLACMDQRKWTEAFTHFQTALEIWQTLGNRRSEVRTLLYMVQCDLAKDDRLQAKRRLKKVEDLVHQYGLENEQHTNWYTAFMECRHILAEE